jgi:hypothetical protein
LAVPEVGITGGITSGVTYFGIVKGSSVPPGTACPLAAPLKTTATAVATATPVARRIRVELVIFLTPLFPALLTDSSVV